MNGMPELFPSTQPFPKQWTSAINSQALAHAKDAYPSEAAAVVINGEYIRLQNRSFNPDNEVELSGDDLVLLASADVFFHTHPNGLPCPSKADMILQEQVGCPFVIMPYPDIMPFCFGVDVPMQNMVGRAFRHGVHDCYSMIRDWHILFDGYRLPYAPRSWNWWHAGEDMYLQNWEPSGFKQIDLGDATQPGDVILFRFKSKVPHHGAVVIDKDIILHHIGSAKPLDYSRLSGSVPRLRWIRLAHSALRHERLT